MKKYLLLLSCSIIAANAAHALTAAEQLEATKQIFVKDFQRMDDNKDGKLSLDEYLSHQFEDFKANIIKAEGFGNGSNKGTSSEVSKTDVELAGTSQAMEDMANFDIDDIDIDNLDLGDEPKKLTKDDVMPKDSVEEVDIAIEAPEIDLTVSEEDSLKELLDNMDKKDAPVEEVKEDKGISQEEKDKQINMMMETIKKTLPKKIDSETTWTDIEYADSTISYIYKANIDTTNLSSQDKSALKKSIKTQVCPNTYKDMCPKIKPMFIDEGINMQIRYIDKRNNALSSCEFNQETCSD